MIRILKQSTATNLLIGPFLDDTDGKTAETALTIAQADVRLSKNGGNMAQKNNATSCTHDELGYYSCPLSTTDTNTLGHLKVMVHKAGALPVWGSCIVVTANVYDTLFSTDQLDVNVTNIAGTAQTANDNGADINTILSRIVGTIASGTHNPQSGDSYARLGAPAGASIAADLLAIDNFVDDLEGRLTAARAGYLDNLNIGENVAGFSQIDDLDVPSAGANASAVWGATENITGDTHTYKRMLATIFMFLFHEMNITDATGAMQVRNSGDTANVITATITDDDTTTNRTKAVIS